MRVALYIRVSTEEQSIRGLSLEAQEADLRAYAKDKGWNIVGTYIDAGKTARKRLEKREEFCRMIRDVEARKIDRILFTRLDRWFRNIADYYKVNEILERNRCDWSTTQEDYDSSTASGRLLINLKLSIAQNEADLTSERINAVFDAKIQNKTVLSGTPPVGYRINAEKRLEIDPESAAMIRDMFEYFSVSGNIRETTFYIRDNHNHFFPANTIKRIIRDKIYIGVYDKRGRTVEDFCDPIVDPELFSRANRFLKNGVKCTPSGHIYLFTGLCKCARCQRRSLINTKKTKYGEYTYYMCRTYTEKEECINQKRIREEDIEEYLLAYLEPEIERYNIATKEKAAKVKKIDRSAIEDKIKRTNDLYINGLISLEDCKAKVAALREQLEQPEEPEQRPITLPDNWKEMYTGLDREKKRAFWRSIIKEIWLNENREVERIIF